MKLLDFERKGNIIRFYLGSDPEFTGDDWDDVPYEDNAGPVYERYVEDSVDIAVPMEYIVTEPSDGNWAKNDMKDGYAPMLVIVKEDEYDFGSVSFNEAVIRKSAHRIYMGSEYCKDDFDYCFIMERKPDRYLA